MSLGAHILARNLGAYDPRHRYLSAYNPRKRYLSAYDPRARYLSHLGCECERTVSALGQDIDTTEPDLPTTLLPPTDTTTFETTSPDVGTTLAPLTNYAGTPLTQSTAAPAWAAPSSTVTMAPAVTTPASAIPSVAQAITPLLGPQQAAAASAAPGTIAGIPMQYFVYGGLGIAALAALSAMRR